MSAPHSIGRTRYGVPTVLSTISGTPTRCATVATASMSRMSPRGLGIDSAKKPTVRGRAAASQAAGLPGSVTNVVVTPRLRRFWARSVRVPPYRLGLATRWSPACASVSNVAVVAAWPDASSSPATPPSRTAIRVSTAACVGLLIRVYVYPSSVPANRRAA